MERKATIILLVAITTLIIGGCKRERVNPFDPGNPNARVVYAPQTKIPSENPQLVKDTLIGDKVYLTYEEGATLPEFEEGDILIGLRGEGYLRKVKDCTVQGNQIIVETEQATIKEAFTRLMIDTTVDIVIPEKKIKLGKIDYHTKTKGYDIYVQSDPGSYSVKDGAMRFEWPNFAIEIRSGGNLAASFKAERVVLWSDLDLNFYYDFSLIDGLHVLASMLHEDSLNFVNATLDMYTEIPLLSAEIPLVPPIGVPIPLGPIVVTPEVGINADLQSMLQITQSIFAQADANFYAEVEAGAEYDHGDWHAIWEKNLTGSLNMDFGISISVNCENQCGVELEANIKLFGVVGGGIWVLPYGYFDFYNPPFHYEGGVGVKSGAQLMLGICGWELEREFTLAEYEIELFESYQQQNLPPNTPTVPVGPTSGTVGEEIDFSTSAVDPNGDDVAIRFDWGDGIISNWSTYVPSGQTVTMSHTWSTPGTYYVKAQAKDVNGAISDWSAGHEVVITHANNPPNAPSTPSGPDNVQVGEDVTFTTSTLDPDGDNVAIRFSWGDGDTSDWSSYVPSGQSVSMSHTYTTAGTYYVKAQAKDVNGATSGWSSGHKIVVLETQNIFVENFDSYPVGGIPDTTVWDVRIVDPSDLEIVSNGYINNGLKFSDPTVDTGDIGDASYAEILTNITGVYTNVIFYVNTQTNNVDCGIRAVGDWYDYWNTMSWYLRFKGDSVYYLDSSHCFIPIAKINPGVWYKFEVIIDWSTCSYFIYINDNFVSQATFVAPSNAGGAYFHLVEFWNNVLLTDGFIVDEIVLSAPSTIGTKLVLKKPRLRLAKRTTSQSIKTKIACSNRM